MKYLSPLIKTSHEILSVVMNEPKESRLGMGGLGPDL